MISKKVNISNGVIALIVIIFLIFGNIVSCVEPEGGTEASKENSILDNNIEIEENEPKEDIEPVANFFISDIEDGYPKQPNIIDTIIKHKFYHLSYNKKYLQANWVTYLLTKKMVEDNKAERTDRFVRDPNLEDNYAITSDYTNSGYDRGHLCPAADMNFSETAMNETFYMSNISPQKPDFNRGIWKKLEEWVREQTYENDSLYIVIGSVFGKRPRRIGKHKVGIPKYFYKIVFDISKKDGYNAIAFIFLNRKLNKSFFEYAISIDELEKKIGIDFFPDSPTNEIEKIESNLNLDFWKKK